MLKTIDKNCCVCWKYRIYWTFAENIGLYRTIPKNIGFYSINRTIRHPAVIDSNSPTHSGFLKGKSLTVIISGSWFYICQADIYTNTAQVESLSYDGSFNLKIMSSQNSLTIPWHDITKFPDNSLTSVKWPKFLDIFPKFPDFSLTWRKFPWHVATLPGYKRLFPRTKKSATAVTILLIYWSHSNLYSKICFQHFGFEIAAMLTRVIFHKEMTNLAHTSFSRHFFSVFLCQNTNNSNKLKVIRISERYRISEQNNSVADPRFSKRGAPTNKVLAPAYYLAKFFLKNCMKMKEIGPRKGACLWRPLPPPGFANAIVDSQLSASNYKTQLQQNENKFTSCWFQQLFHQIPSIHTWQHKIKPSVTKYFWKFQ